MTTLLFIRHGEATHNLQPRLIGGRSHNAPLTRRGIEQARLFGNYLRVSLVQPDAVVTSGALRTNQTAVHALNSAGLTSGYAVDPRFHEVDQAIHEGADRTKVYKEETVKQLKRDGIYGSLPGAESIADTQARMLHASNELAAAYPEGTVLVFSHGLAIRSLVGFIQHSTKNEILNMQTDNLSVTEITITTTAKKVVSVGKNVIKRLD